MRGGALRSPGTPQKLGLRDSELRPVRLVRVWVREGLTQADS